MWNVIVWIVLVILFLHWVAKFADETQAQWLKDHREAVDYFETCIDTIKRNFSPELAQDEFTWIKARCPQRYWSFNDIFALDQEWCRQRNIAFYHFDQAVKEHSLLCTFRLDGKEECTYGWYDDQKLRYKCSESTKDKEAIIINVRHHLCDAFVKKGNNETLPWCLRSESM